MKLNCEYIFKNTPNCEYNPRNFAALKHRVRLLGEDGQMCAPTFLIFPSGNMVCNGARSIKDAFKAATNLLTHLGVLLKTSFADTTLIIQNLVSHTNLFQEINLSKFADRYTGMCSYEPELFPGLRLDISLKNRAKNVTACVNLFSSGKLVITGCKSIEDINEAYHEILFLFKLPNYPP